MYIVYVIIYIGIKGDLFNNLYFCVVWNIDVNNIKNTLNFNQINIFTFTTMNLNSFPVCVGEKYLRLNVFKKFP